MTCSITLVLHLQAQYIMLPRCNQTVTPLVRTTEITDCSTKKEQRQQETEPHHDRVQQRSIADLFLTHQCQATAVVSFPSLLPAPQSDSSASPQHRNSDPHNNHF